MSLYGNTLDFGTLVMGLESGLQMPILCEAALLRTVGVMCCSEKGYLVKDSVILACEILECTPWLEFGDADLTFSDSDVEAHLPSPAHGAHWAPVDAADAAADSHATAESHLLRALSSAAALPFVKQAGVVPGGEAGGDSCAVVVPSLGQAQAALHANLSCDERLLATLCGSLRGFLQV
jgi:hypothetical protein